MQPSYFFFFLKKWHNANKNSTDLNIQQNVKNICGATSAPAAGANSRGDVDSKLC